MIDALCRISPPAPPEGLWRRRLCRADAVARVSDDVADTLHVCSQPLTRGGYAGGCHCDQSISPKADRNVMGRAVAISNSLVRGSLLTAAWMCVAFWAVSVMRLSREPVFTNKLVANIRCVGLLPRPKRGEATYTVVQRLRV